MGIGLPDPEVGYPVGQALYPVSVRRTKVFASGFLQIPPSDGHPCL